MKKLMLMLMVACAAITVEAQDQLPKHYLQQDVYYAENKKDIQQAVRMGTEGDNQALAQMIVEGKLSMPTTKRQEVFLTSGMGDLLTSDYLEFRFKGQTSKHWTLREWIEHD